MREFLFRGKRTYSNTWVEGSLVSTAQGNAYIISTVEDRRHATVLVNQCSINVEPETVGQFTGLTDKNGVKIFEGDIVTGYFNHEKIVGYIFYGGNAQFFIQRDGIYGIGLDNSDCWLEVIGNIHDNPELIEGGG